MRFYRWTWQDLENAQRLWTMLRGSWQQSIIMRHSATALSNFTSVSSSPSSSIGAPLCSGTGQRSWAGHWTSMSCLHCHTQEGMHSNNSVQKIRFAIVDVGSGTTQILKDIYLEGLRTNGKLHLHSHNSVQKSTICLCRCWVCNHSNWSPKMAIFPMERDFSKSESKFLIILPKNLMFKAKIMYFGLILGAR